MAKQDEAGRTEYDLTERAGRRVAGRIVGDATTMLLTDAEAEHELREGTIAPKGKGVPKAFTDSKVADKLREEAAAFVEAGRQPSPARATLPASAPGEVPADPPRAPVAPLPEQTQKPAAPAGPAPAGAQAGTDGSTKPV